jgi:hypothetical protein
MQEALQLKQNELEAQVQRAASALAASDAELLVFAAAAEAQKSTISQLQRDIDSAAAAADLLEQERATLMQCMATADEVAALKDEKAMALLEYERAMMAVLVTLLLVFGAERVSDYLRRRVLDGGKLA